MTAHYFTRKVGKIMCYQKPSLENVLKQHNVFLESLEKSEKEHYLISLDNYLKRKEHYIYFGNVEEGDLCYFDFGNAYDKEIGYQHLALVLSCCGDKVYVVPMVSYHEGKVIINETKELLYPNEENRLKHITLLFLNDSKWVTKNRIIQKVGKEDSKKINKLKFKIKALI